MYEIVVRYDECTVSQITEKLPYGKTKVRKILNGLVSQRLIRVGGNGTAQNMIKQGRIRCVIYKEV